MQGFLTEISQKSILMDDTPDYYSLTSAINISVSHYMVI